MIAVDFLKAFDKVYTLIWLNLLKNFLNFHAASQLRYNHAYTIVINVFIFRKINRQIENTALVEFRKAPFLAQF